MPMRGRSAEPGRRPHVSQSDTECRMPGGAKTASEGAPGTRLYRSWLLAETPDMARRAISTHASMTRSTSPRSTFVLVMP
jgi:hypothetical protein